MFLKFLGRGAACCSREGEEQRRLTPFSLVPHERATEVQAHGRAVKATERDGEREGKGGMKALCRRSPETSGVKRDGNEAIA